MSRVVNFKRELKFWILFSGQFSRQNQNLQEQNTGNLVKHKIVADPKFFPIFEMKNNCQNTTKETWDCKEIVCSCFFYRTR